MDQTEENEPLDSSEKLIPEWSRSADDQVVLAGILAVVVFFGILGWSAFTGDDDDVDSIAAAVTTADDEDEDGEEENNSTPVNEVSTAGDVQSAVQGLPGDITGVGDGSVAVLTGFVANQGESDEAETAALGVTGIESVENNLELLEPPVITALEAEDVATPEAEGVGTVVTVRGTVESQAQADTALESAAAVPGVTQVIDELNIPLAQQPEPEPEEQEPEPEVEEQVIDITDQLNELPQVQFDTASSTINQASFADLDQAVELLSQIDENYEGTIEVQGYTDTDGDPDRNQTLSEDRAQAVLNYLVENGAPEALLTSAGFGPTTEFGPNLEDNRVVRFEPIG